VKVSLVPVGSDEDVMVAVRACGTYVAQYVWVGRPVVKLLFIRE